MLVHGERKHKHVPGWLSGYWHKGSASGCFTESTHINTPICVTRTTAVFQYTRMAEWLRWLRRLRRSNPTPGNMIVPFQFRKLCWHYNMWTAQEIEHLTNWHNRLKWESHYPTALHSLFFFTMVHQHFAFCTSLECLLMPANTTRMAEWLMRWIQWTNVKRSNGQMSLWVRTPLLAWL